VSPSPSTSGNESRVRVRQDLTTGSIPRHLLNLAIPSALTNLMTYSTTFVDMIWLGRISPQAIAAVATFNYFWFLFALLNQMIGNGSVALISRTYGAGEHEECRRVFGQTFVFKLIVAVLVAALGISCQRLAFSLFGARDEVLELALVYGTIIFAATPLMFSTFTLKTGFRAIGDMRNLFWISFATMMLNLALDPFLIFPQIRIGPFPTLGMVSALHLPGAGLGIAGAAWGTVIAFGIVFIVALVFFFSGWTSLKVKPRHFLSLSWETARRIMRIGAPPATANFIEHIANLLVGAAIMSYGTTIFAAQGVNQIIRRLLRVTTMGINFSLITLVGQNLGARNSRRAEYSVICGYVLVASLMLLIGGLVFAAAPSVARLFVPGNDAESLATADWVVRILRINAFVLMPFGLSRVARSAFQGSGDTNPTFYSTLLSTLGVQLPLILGGVYLLNLPDPRFIWWSEAAAYTVGAVFMYLIFRRGHWKRVQV